MIARSRARRAARAALAGLIATASLAQAQSVGDALASGDLICEFSEGWRRSLIADLVGQSPRVDLLIAFERVTDSTAQTLSSQRPGRRVVRVRATDHAVHFIEPTGPSVRVTSLTGCERTKLRAGTDVCVRFTAQHAWHFDTAAMREPDASLERQPSGAATGACEPWIVD